MRRPGRRPAHDLGAILVEHVGNPEGFHAVRVTLPCPSVVLDADDALDVARLIVICADEAHVAEEIDS